MKVDDLEAAIRTYEDGLGMKATEVWEHPNGERGALFAVAPAAIELFEQKQWDFVDQHEAGQTFGQTFALRVEAQQAEKVAEQLVKAGATPLSEKTEVPWGQQVIRLIMHDDVHMSVSELDAKERVERAAQRGLLPN